MPLRLLIVDDNAYFLEAARRLFEGEGMTVVGVASTTAAALERYEALAPDVTLVDVNLGEESGLEVARLITRSHPQAARGVILISTYPELDVVDLAEAIPAAGFLSKSSLSGTAVLDLLRGAESDGRGADG